MHFFFIILMFLLLITSQKCISQPFSLKKEYHNTTSHYNAYFYARERIQEVENSIKLATSNDYDNVLDIYPILDSSIISPNNALLEDVIKKSSVAIQYHEISKWRDKCYIILGKARLYKLEYENSIETFKFVNAKGREKKERQDALIMLIKTYIHRKEYKNAHIVMEHIRQQELHNANIQQYNLVCAYFYQQQEEYIKASKHLIKAIPFIKNKTEKARIYFILGQMHKLLGNDSVSYQNYKLALKNSKSYELSFYSKLHISSVVNIENEADIKKTRIYFKKLLKDPKNKEYKDRIYYEKGNFELKHNNIEESIENYNLALTNDNNKPLQKSLAYLSLAKIYYERLKNYPLAKQYYDSTLAIMPKSHKGYEELEKYHKILIKFVEQITIIQTEDSILALASLGKEAAKIKILQIKILQQEEERQKNINLKKKKTKNISQTDPFPQKREETIGINASEIWYFYIPDMVSKGEEEFKRKWGKRDLQDNWRIASKIKVSQEQKNTQEESETIIAQENRTQDTEIKLDDIWEQLPNTEEKRKISYQKLETAYYTLGNIYYFDLQEPENAIITYTILVTRFPKSQYAPEVLYLIFLLKKEQNKTEETEFYKQKIKKEFPKSIFAKLVDNPRYREDIDEAGKKLSHIYSKAYILYKNDNYNEALTLLQEGMNTYPENSFIDNAKLLEVMLIGKIEGEYTYQIALDNFIRKYPESDVIEFAKTLSKSYIEHQQNKINSAKIKFIENENQEHYFIIVYPHLNELNETLPNMIETFIKDSLKNENVSLGNLIIDTKNIALFVSSFPDKTESLTFYSLFLSQNPLSKKEYTQYVMKYFVINKDNFTKLYQTKGIEEYIDFFKKHY